MTQPTMPDEVTALARRYAIDINIGGETPDWQRLLGVREFSGPQVEPTHEDDGTYDDEGWASFVRTALAWTGEITLSHRRGANGEWNPVHRFLRDSSTNFGASSYIGVRIYDRDPTVEDDAWQGVALVTWAPEGGDPTALDRVTVTLTGHGKLVAIDHPEVESVPGETEGGTETHGSGFVHDGDEF